MEELEIRTKVAAEKVLSNIKTEIKNEIKNDPDFSLVQN
jgi:hypothetical protein